MICIRAHAVVDRATVRKVHGDALSAGAKDNGGPGIRGHYDPNYYSAYFHDLAGYNVEVMTVNVGKYNASS